jgi:plasmid stabilization system protein ParE
MSEDVGKSAKKAAKAEIKAQKKAAKLDNAAAASAAARRLPDGVSVAVQNREGGTELVVTGLREDQLKRLLPEITREVMITVTEEQNQFRAGLMRFVREGLFQTIVKIIAGLIVGILLISLGL